MQAMPTKSTSAKPTKSRAQSRAAALQIVMSDGTPFEGTPIEIVRSMLKCSHESKSMTLDLYMARTADRAKLVFDAKLDALGATLEARADAFVRSLIRNGLAMETN
jgi:hypothetical protein